MDDGAPPGRVYSSKRRGRYAAFHGLYEPAPDQGAACVYCGATGKLGVDHVPPLVTVAWLDDEARWLYPCCSLCNVMASAHPMVCLPMRAEFIRCRLRGELVKTRAGVASRYAAERIVATGTAVKARLSDGSIRQACRCSTCSRIGGGLAKAQDLGEG